MRLIVSSPNVPEAAMKKSECLPIKSRFCEVGVVQYASTALGL